MEKIKQDGQTITFLNGKDVREYLSDSIKEGLSNCCGADVILPDMCSKCKEHCSIEKEIPETEKKELKK